MLQASSVPLLIHTTWELVLTLVVSSSADAHRGVAEDEEAPGVLHGRLVGQMAALQHDGRQGRRRRGGGERAEGVLAVADEKQVEGGE